MDKMGTRIGRILGILVVVLVGIFAEGSWAQPPDIVSTTPGDGSINVLTNTIITVRFSASMDTNVTVVVVKDEYGNKVLGTIQWSTTSLPNDTLRFIPTNTLKPATHYRVNVFGNSTLGEGGGFEFYFITKHSTADTTPSTVQAVYPYNGMTGVPIGSSIYIKFSEAMVPWSVTTPGNITLTGPGISGPADYSVFYDFRDGDVEIKKNTPFFPSSTYTVTISTNVKDLRGNWLKNPYQWSFTTGTTETTPPTVTQTIPASGDEKVNVRPQFHVIFSEEMDENTLTTANISLYNNTGGTGVPIDIFETDHDWVTFGPQSNLVNGHNYTVTIGTGVKDPSGNGLSSPYTWSFTVAEAGVDSDPILNGGLRRDSNWGRRWTDGTTRVELYLDAIDDHTDPLTVTAATASKNWTLTKSPGKDQYKYESTINEGLSSGTHTLTFTIKDGASPQNTVTFQRNIFIFESNPTLSSPANGATGVSTTPTFQWSYSSTLRPVKYTVFVLDGSNLETPRQIWQGWMVDSGPATYSISIPSDKALAPNTTYYWGIGGQNYDYTGDTFSQFRSFTTGGTPPPLPSFSWVLVRSDDRTTGMQWNVAAKVVGPSPADIRELKVTGPGGFQYIFTEDNIIQGEFNGLYYWRSLTNPLSNGTYTFTATDLMGRTSTSNWDFTFVSLPRVDSSTMSPSNNAYVGTTTPTFSWGSVGADYSYRIMIMDWNGQEDNIYISPLAQDTQVTVPSGYLLPNTPYKWRVEVFDSSQQNRSVSDTIGFSTGSYPYTLDIQGITWSDNTYYGGNRKLHQALVLGPLPTHITSLTVTGPGGFNHTFKESEIWWGHIIGNVYVYWEAGLPADGTYNYNIIDTFGGSDSFSKEQTSVVIPIVERSSMSPANNAYLDTLNPTFTWSAVEGSPRYYRISINDWKERYSVYQSLRSTDLFATVPAGVLKPERSYKWRVEVFDDPDRLVADNRSSSGWNCFTTKPASTNVPDISVTPLSYDFGNVEVKKSKTASFKVKNNGKTDLLISTSITGTDVSMFTITSGGGVSKTIKPGKTLTIKVSFKPTSAGSKSSTLEITSNDPDTPTIDIPLTATLPATTPDISVAQTSLDFGSIKVGKKVTKTLKITNNGSGDLMITLSGLEETDFGIQGSSSVTIKSKKSYSLKVLFAPKSAGLETATLSMISNDPDAPTLEISLSGTGQ